MYKKVPNHLKMTLSKQIILFLFLQIFVYNPFLPNNMRQIISFNVHNYKNINRFIRNRIKNLYGYPMKVLMFAVKQKAIKQSDGSYTG